jgi:hypothetical protein
VFRLLEHDAIVGIEGGHGGDDTVPVDGHGFLLDGKATHVAVITDEYMRDMLSRTRTYSMVLLKRAGRYSDPDAPALIWEHGRRNFSLRADGVLAVVCPIADDSGWAGIGIFDASQEETARIMDGDPAVQAGVLSYEVHPVRGFPGDALPPAPGDA